MGRLWEGGEGGRRAGMGVGGDGLSRRDSPPRSMVGKRRRGFRMGEGVGWEVGRTGIRRLGRVTWCDAGLFWSCRRGCNRLAATGCHCIARVGQTRSGVDADGSRAVPSRGSDVGLEALQL